MMKQQQWNSVMLLSDLDGTLLRQDKTISAEDLLAIQRLRQAGGKVALATGRTIQSARPYWTQLQIDCPIILYNGAAIYDPVSQKLCYTVTLPETAAALVQTVLEHFPEIGAEVLRADGTYVLRNNKEEAEHVALCRVTPVVCTVEEMPKQQWLKVLFAMDPNGCSRCKRFYGSIRFPVQHLCSLRIIFMRCCRRGPPKEAPWRDTVSCFRCRILQLLQWAIMTMTSKCCKQQIIVQHLPMRSLLFRMW